jgi:hypothetical protein
MFSRVCVFLACFCCPDLLLPLYFPVGECPMHVHFLLLSWLCLHSPVGEQTLLACIPLLFWLVPLSVLSGSECPSLSCFPSLFWLVPIFMLSRMWVSLICLLFFAVLIYTSFNAIQLVSTPLLFTFFFLPNFSLSLPALQDVSATCLLCYF